MQPVVLLDHLPAAHRQFINDNLKQDRRNLLFTPRGRRKIEHCWHSSLDGRKQSEWTSASTALNGGRTHQVSYLVADQRLRTAKQYGKQHFVPLLAGRDRAIVLIYNLDN